MTDGTPSERELDGYRSGADRFIAELDEEYYLHYAGLKPEFELRPIYERHADLTDLATIRRVGEAVNGKENLELFRFGCEGFLGELTREHAEKIAESETKLEIQHEGEAVGYRMLPPTIANTADRDTRARLEAARNDLTEEHLNPLYLDAVQTTQRAMPDLGAPTYFHLYRDRFEYDLEGLAAQCRAFLDSTERLYEDSMDRVLRERVGVGLAEAERWDVRRFFRGSGWDEAFPADRMLPALRGTLVRPRDRPRRAAQRPPRRRGAADEEPARLLRPDRDPGQGDARDPAAGRARRLVRALPRGRPHRALRLHEPEPEDGGEAARRQRRHRGLGDALRPPDRRPRLALEHAQLPAARRLCGRGRRPAPLLRAPLLREAALRDRVPRGRRT